MAVAGWPAFQILPSILGRSGYGRRSRSEQTGPLLYSGDQVREKCSTDPAWAIVLYVLGGFVPWGVAVVLIGRREGRRGLGELWQRMIQPRTDWRMYLAAIPIVGFGTACPIALNACLGHALELRLFLVQPPSVLPRIILGSLLEELGWRGYARDRLPARWSPLSASLIVGAVWALWHLPCSSCRAPRNTIRPCHSLAFSSASRACR